MGTRRHTWLAYLGLSAAVMVAATWGSAVHAAPFPSGPIKLIVPYGPGGASEVAARAAAEGMAKVLGQVVVVENRPGAAGAIAVQAAVGAEPDGHTLVLMGASMWALPATVKPSPFDPKDLKAVSTLGDVNFGLFVPASLPARSMNELLAHAREQKDPLAYGTISLAMDAISTAVARAAGVNMIRVSYKGAPQAMADLIGGRLQMVFGPVGNGMGPTKDGKLRLLATHPHRTPLSPGVPTLAESGVTSVTTPTFMMIAAPAGTPGPVVERLSKAIAEAMAQPAIRERFESLGLAPGSASPEATAALVVQAQEAYAEVQRVLDAGTTGLTSPK